MGAAGNEDGTMRNLAKRWRKGSSGIAVVAADMGGICDGSDESGWETG